MSSKGGRKDCNKLILHAMDSMRKGITPSFGEQDLASILLHKSVTPGWAEEFIRCLSKLLRNQLYKCYTTSFDGEANHYNAYDDGELLPVNYVVAVFMHKLKACQKVCSLLLRLSYCLIIPYSIIPPLHLTPTAQ